MKTAIIGLGNIGSVVAGNLIAGGEHIMVVDKGDGRAKSFAEGSGGKAVAVDLSEALAMTGN